MSVHWQAEWWGRGGLADVQSANSVSHYVVVPTVQAQFRDQTVLIGVDDMDLFKGIELKLQAVERVLEQHADWRGKLVLVQVTNAPRCADSFWDLPFRCCSPQQVWSEMDAASYCTAAAV